MGENTKPFEKRVLVQRIRIGIVALLILTLLFGLIRYQSIMRTMPTVWYPSIRVFQTNQGYKVYLLEGNRIDGSMYFSADGQLIRSWNIKAINEENIANFLGKHMDEITEEYGAPHADVGSGFSFPAYITQNAKLIVLHESENIVGRIAVKDLLTDTIIEEYESAEIDDVE